MTCSFSPKPHYIKLSGEGELLEIPGTFLTATLSIPVAARQDFAGSEALTCPASLPTFKTMRSKGFNVGAGKINNTQMWVLVDENLRETQDQKSR